ncbi:MAG: hypothetical protein GW833_03945 [Desulfuromonadales bacterium]|nr:hypothetical protein [Desulfuromonadales bacterium]
MGIQIKPSDLYFRYPRKKENRDLPKFSGKPDARPFDRYDLYEVIPMFETVMDTLGTQDQTVLQRVEEILDQLPGFITTREMIFDALMDAAGDFVESSPDPRL